MASTKLPNEIFKALTDFIHPFDLIAFVTTCKTFHALATSRLREHRELQHKYSAIKIIEHDCSGPAFHYRHAFDVMLAIERNPWLVCYMRTVEFKPTHRGFFNTDWLDDCSFTPNTAENLAALSKKLAEFLESFGLSGDEMEHWRIALDTGDHSASFGVLLSLLSSLRSLILAGRGSMYKEWLDPVFRMANNVESVKPILTELRTVKILHWDTEGGEDPKVLEEFVLIPSHRKLEAHMLGDEIGNGEYLSLATKNPDDQRVSRIQQVDIACSGLAANSLAELVRPMVDLRRLDYEDYMGWADDGDDNGVAQYKFDFDSRVGALLKSRGLVWKVGDLKDHGDDGLGENMVKVRTSELASEVEDIEELSLQDELEEDEEMLLAGDKD